MNVLGVLYLVLLIRSSIAPPVCSGGRLSNPSRRNVPTTVPSGLVLDLEKPDDKLCQSFDYNTDGIPTRLIMPKDDNVITSIKEGSLDIWKASGDNVACAFVTLRLSDGKPVIAQLTKNGNGNPMVTFLKKDDKWDPVNDYSTEVIKLRKTPKSLEDFTLDISAFKDTDQCTVFQVDLLGITTRHFYPKPGHVAIQVKDGNKELWKCGNSDHCVSCIIHKHGSVELLEVGIVENCSKRWRYFEKNGQEWREIEKTEFDEKEQAIIGGKFVSALLDKVDASLFDLEESLEDGIKVLKLTAKEGTSTNELLYDGKTVWEGKKKSCPSAILYMDGEKPTLAVLVTKDKNGKDGKVYQYHDGNKWRDTKEDDHKEKLAELKEKCKPGKTLDISKRDSSVGSYYITYPGYGKIAHNFDLKSATVTKVVDGEHVIWTAKENGHKCIDAKNIVTGGKESLRLEIKADKNEDLWFRKRDGKWTIIPQSNSRA
ncbi:signal peptide containing protein [Theileria equi strain WA]|uniref:Signal peptide containing protein n=1 Tax=Theileria equi strain WA TaxID=1537102 RepID=L1LAH4_THEEQ|nr:signal peptide containing protein [Theileria equi strain WA]EKX72173.1 signal peptide containing protein [Theileria equi strain WA]|eukprot:XP_004831625.1 signal peptide containing protein [Theileria equi strain WA]